MKKALLIISVAAILASCGNKQAKDLNASSEALATDTTGLAEFQSLKKEQLQPIEMQGIPVDNNIIATAATSAEASAKTKIIYRDRPAKTRTIVKYEKPDLYGSSANNGNTRDAVYRKDGAPVDNAPSAGNGTTTDAGKGAGTVATSVPGETPPAKKDGWSKAAKGAAIGGASGAVLGAIISKNKVTGAILGGVVGAAGGYAIGRGKDKKDGRY